MKTLRGIKMIPPFNLKRQYEEIKTEVNSAVSSVLEEGNFILGKNVEEFEKEFASWTRGKHCVSVASGTDALILALKSIGVGKGDEVILPANTASPTAMAVLSVNATPVLVDCDDYFLMDIEEVKKKITDKTKAIIPVHLYGQPCDMNELKEAAGNIKIIEDCAQSHGSEYNGGKVSSSIACFSFYPTKNLGAYGDGGAVVTDDEKLAEKLKMLRYYGQKETYDSKSFGYNSRLDEIQAAVLRVKLKHLDKWIESRQKIAKLYDELLSGVVETPKVKENRKHAYHLYVIKTDKRDELQAFLKENGIGTGIHYPIPIHKQDAFSVEGNYPKSEENAKQVLSLPMFPELTDEEVTQICEKIKEFMNKHQSSS
jgi:dTDP-4-amino-4,6-dideoxygalactose transaminase